jgi:hypothetical protein
MMTSIVHVPSPFDSLPAVAFCASNPDGIFSYPADTTALATLYDMNGGNTTVSQATGGNRPTFERGELNGKPAISMNASQWFNAVSNSINNPNAGRTFAAVFKLNVVTGTQRLFGKLLTAMFSFVDAKYTFTTWNGASGTSSTSTANQVVASTWQYSLFAYKPTWTTDFYKNGSFIENVANAANTTSVSDYYIGTRDGTQHFVNGAFTDLYDYTHEFTAWEVQHLQSYLAVNSGI